MNGFQAVSTKVHMNIDVYGACTHVYTCFRYSLRCYKTGPSFPSFLTYLRTTLCSSCAQLATATSLTFFSQLITSAVSVASVAADFSETLPGLVISYGSILLIRNEGITLYLNKVHLTISYCVLCLKVNILKLPWSHLNREEPAICTFPTNTINTKKSIIKIGGNDC